MNLQTYIDLGELLRQNGWSREEYRAFGLENSKLSPIDKLAKWVKDHRSRLPKPKVSDTFCSYLYHITLLLGFLALVVGFVSGVGLLSYSGKAPVNLIYFLSVSVVLPLLTMFLSIISIFGISKEHNSILHLSPAYWLERIFALFFAKRGDTKQPKIEPRVLNYLVLQRAQLLALFFSIGLLIALLFKVTTSDIAFAWSTTLQIKSQSFHSFLSLLAYPWHWFAPSALPTLDVVAHSHYFRLGGRLDAHMIANAGELGVWWRFLAMATLCYAIIPRVFLYIFVSIRLKGVLKNSMINMDGIKSVLQQMDTPVIKSRATEAESAYTFEQNSYSRVVDNASGRYDISLGWAIDVKEVCLLDDMFDIQSDKCMLLGGANTTDEDSKIIEQCSGDVIVYVKSWEPPTMDWSDMIEHLAKVAKKITIVPIGTKDDDYKPQESDLHIWLRKMATIDNPKVWLCKI